MQKIEFLKQQGDEWYRRNSSALANFSSENDLLTDLISQTCKTSSAIGEVGCSYPVRLQYLANKYAAFGFGIDPSKRAIENGKSSFPALSLQVGTAEKLPWEDSSIDILIYGFCLYLCDRQDLFLIASEGNRVLKDEGYLVVHDFLTPHPLRVPYLHCKGIYTYKFDHSLLWKWNPHYLEVRRHVYDHCSPHKYAGSSFNLLERTGIVILKKSSTIAAYQEFRLES